MTSKPCPFCGGQQGTSSSQNMPAVVGNPDKPIIHYVTCMDCGARGPSAFSYDESVRLWNERGRFRVADRVRVAGGMYRVIGEAMTSYKVIDAQTGAVSFSVQESEMKSVRGGVR